MAAVESTEKYCFLLCYIYLTAIVVLHAKYMSVSHKTNHAYRLNCPVVKISSTTAI